MLQPAIGKEMQSLAQLVHAGQVTGDSDVEATLMQLSGFPRFNALMVGQGGTKPVWRELSLAEGHLDPVSGAAVSLPYLHAPGTQVGPAARGAVKKQPACLT